MDVEPEDGEIIESDEELPKDVPDTIEVYTCLERPVAPRPPPIQPPPIVSDDSDASSAGDSDSDSDGGGRKRARPTPTAAAADGDSMDTGHNPAFAEAARKFQARRARLAVWSSVLAEDGITDGLADGLGTLRSGPRVERDVESYQLPEPPPRAQRLPTDAADNPRKRGFQQASQGWRKKKTQAVVLEPLAVTEDSPVEQVAADIALKLREEKPEIVANVVKIVGTKKSIELFEETKSVEEGGGMLVNNWSRRRTPGGVFIQLLKTDPEVTEEQVRDVFREDRRQQDRERKVAKRRRQRARLARLAATAAADGSERESGEASSDSAADESDADSEAAQSAGSRAERQGEDGMEDGEPLPPAAEEMAEDSIKDELEVPNEIIFE